jgi:vacuolar-type H+-ATPase subunit C/Vma6
MAAVLETFLVDAGAMRELAEDGATADVLTVVRRGPVYADAPVAAPGDPLRVAADLEAALVTYVRWFVTQCPEPRVADLFLVPYDLRDLANGLKARHAGLERRPVELSDLPGGDLQPALAGRPRLAAVARDVDALAEGGELDAFAIDLIVDAAFIEALYELVRPLGSELVDRWVERRQQLAAVEAVLRAKAAGMDREAVQRHLLDRVSVGAELAALNEAESDQVVDALTQHLPAEAAEAWDASAGAESAQRLAARFDAILAELLEPARFVPAGPERVFRYLWHAFREHRDLRAVLGGQAGRLEPALVASALRGGDG